MLWNVSLVDERFELLGKVFVKVHVQRDLLALLGEDVARQKDVQGVVDASAKVLDSLPIVFLLLSRSLI